MQVLGAMKRKMQTYLTTAISRAKVGKLHSMFHCINVHIWNHIFFQYWIRASSMYLIPLKCIGLFLNVIGKQTYMILIFPN